MAHVDELAKDQNGVECYLRRQESFNWSPHAKVDETDRSEETSRAFLLLIRKKHWLTQKNFGLRRARKLTKTLKKG